MRRAFIVTLFLILISCGKKITIGEIENLNGYWEIEKVTFADGNSKDYKVNAAVDFFEVKDLKGYRKKVHPKFDGTFQTSNDAESFSIVQNEDILAIHYKNDMSEWTEQLTEISANSFSVITDDGITYRYRRFQPINGNN